jgi:hypothetical protein
MDPAIAYNLILPTLYAMTGCRFQHRVQLRGGRAIGQADHRRNA